MRYFVLSLLPFMAIFLQSTLFSSYSIKDALPDLVLIFVIFYAFINGEKKGLVYGFLCGLFEDIYMGRFIGINALSKGLTACVIGRLQVRFYNDNLLVSIIAVFIGTLLNSLFMLILGLSAFKVFNVNIFIIKDVLFQSMYNMVLSVPLYIWYYNSSQKGVLSLNGER